MDVTAYSRVRSNYAAERSSKVSQPTEAVPQIKTAKPTNIEASFFAISDRQCMFIKFILLSSVFETFLYTVSAL